MAADAEQATESVRTNQMAFLTPLEVERNELGYELDEVRGKVFRVITNDRHGSTARIFFVHGGGGRGGQFKHQFKAFRNE